MRVRDDEILFERTGVLSNLKLENSLSFLFLLVLLLSLSTGKAPEMEPPFPSFKKEYESVACVKDPRADFNKLISKSNITYCARNKNYNGIKLDLFHSP